MISESQKTISKEGSLTGIGLHSGKMTEVFFSPGVVDSGIHFLKNGISVGVLGRDDASFLTQDALRCSAIGDKELKVLTVEHLLAAIFGLGISNLRVDVHGDEIPAMDGSAAPFIRLFRELGTIDQIKERYAYSISEPLFCHESGKAIAAFPSEQFEVGYCLDYDYPGLRNQRAQFKVTADVFEREIAPARTFCTADEARELKSRGFGLGGTPENNIVVSPDGAHEKSLRFSDECVRHKILDVVGDLSLLGFPVKAKVIGIRSGHALNRKLVQAIREQKSRRKND